MGRNGDRNTRSSVDWTCKTCCNRAGKPWRNKADSKLCTHCNLAKGSCFGAKVVRGGDDPAVRTAVRADRKTPADKEADRAKSLLAEERKKRCDEKAAHEKEVASLRSKLAASGSMEVDENPEVQSDSDTAALKAAINNACDALARLRKLEETEPNIRFFIPDYDSQIEAAKQAVEKAKADKRAANPLQQRIDQSFAHKSKMATRLEEAREAAEDMQEDLKKLQAEIITQAVAVEAAEAALDKADRELSELVAQVSPKTAAAAESLPADAAGAVANDAAMQETIAKAIAAARVAWEQDAATRWEASNAAIFAERDQLLAEAHARYQKEQDEVDDDDSASVADTDCEPAAKRQKEKEKKAAVIARRKESSRRFTEDVQKANLKVKK